MACNLRRLSNGVWFMAQDDALDAKVVPPIAIAEFGRLRIVIPANPDPFFDSCTKRGERLSVGLRHAFARASVMKAITEANNPGRLIGLDNGSEAYQRVVAVERWNEPASRRRAGALLQMQVGDDERSLGGKPSRSTVIKRQGEACKNDRDRGAAQA